MIRPGLGRGLGRDPRRWLRAARYELAAWKGDPSYQRFVIVSRSRSGSNLLVSLLDAHPEIRVEGELLGRLEGRSPKDILDRLFRPHPPRVKAVGFKYFYYHPIDGDPAATADLLDPGTYRVVHLRRRNPLRTEISRRIAGRSDAWSRRRGREAPVERRRVRFTAEDLQRRLRQTRAWERAAEVRWRGPGYLDVTYEDLATDPVMVSERVQRFLGVEPRATRSPLRRQNPEPIRELLENYEELREAFASTEWAPLFDD